MGKFILTKEFNGHSVGTEVAVNDKHDKLMEQFGKKAEASNGLKNKAEKAHKNKAEK